MISGANSTKYYATQTGKYTVQISGKTYTGKAETDTIVLDLATNQTVIPKLRAITDSTVCLGDTVKMTVTDGCNYSFFINGHQINVTTNTAKAKKVIYQGGKINFSNSSAKLLIKNN